MPQFKRGESEMILPNHVNIELTSRCNKSCWMCGRRKNEPKEPGDMPIEMVHKIANQLPRHTVVQLHNNGEPLLYPYLGEAVNALKHCIVGLNTNGKLLCDKAADLMDLNSLTISIIQDDAEGEEQVLKVQSYLELEIYKPPIIVFRFLGKIDDERMRAFTTLTKEHMIHIAYRQLHAPGGSFDYEKQVTMPEMGICLEALNKLSIDRFGNVSPCVRFDPDGKHIIGNINDETLEQIWNGIKHDVFIKYHLFGRRWKASPICATCHFWGIPRG